MFKVKGKPITASHTHMKPKAPPKTPQTSIQAERQILQPPAPFANPQGIANLPVSGRKESHGTDFAKASKRRNRAFFGEA